MAVCVCPWGVADWRTDPVFRPKGKKNKGLRRVDLSATVADSHPTPPEGYSPAKRLTVPDCGAG